MTMQEHDAKCNALWRKYDELKAHGKHLEPYGGEFDQVLIELQNATRARLADFDAGKAVGR